MRVTITKFSTLAIGRARAEVLAGLAPGLHLWRNFTYEYERDRLAIDLINGSDLLRQWVDDLVPSPPI